MHIFKKSKIEHMKKIEPKSMKNRMFFGTSILIGFWEGFGKGLGHQNPRFLHIFRCFFDVVFQARFERRKKRPTWSKKVQKTFKNQPRAKKRRPRTKNMPAWAQHAEFRPPWRKGRALPSKSEKAVFPKAKMQWDLTRLALPAARRIGGPRGSKIEAETRKNRC